MYASRSVSVAWSQRTQTLAVGITKLLHAYGTQNLGAVAVVIETDAAVHAHPVGHPVTDVQPFGESEQ
jgi:hypothetical protein